MSQSHTDTPKPVVVAPSNEQPTEVVVKKPNPIRRTVNFVKSHQKAAIAAVGLAGLVGVSAYAGRKTAPTSPPELLVVDSDTLDEMLDQDETTVA